jgi:hypothetical protein
MAYELGLSMRMTVLRLETRAMVKYWRRARPIQRRLGCRWSFRRACEGARVYGGVVGKVRE